MASSPTGGVIRGAPQNVTDLLRESREMRACSRSCVPPSDPGSPYPALQGALQELSRPGSPQRAFDAENRLASIQSKTGEVQVVALGPPDQAMPLFDVHGETSSEWFGHQPPFSEAESAARRDAELTALHAEMHKMVGMIGDTLRAHLQTEVAAVLADFRGTIQGAVVDIHGLIAELKAARHDVAVQVKAGIDIDNFLKTRTAVQLDVHTILEEIQRVKSDTVPIFDSMKKVQSGQAEEIKALNDLRKRIKTHTSPSIEEIKAGISQLAPLASGLEKVFTAVKSAQADMANFGMASLSADLKQAVKDIDWTSVSGAIIAGQRDVAEPLVSEIQRVKTDTAMIIDELRKATCAAKGNHRYLPLSIRGEPVLIHEGGTNYRVDKKRVTSPRAHDGGPRLLSAGGVAFRLSKDLDDKGAKAKLAKWGTVVEGTDEGDGWLKVLLTEELEHSPQASPAGGARAGPAKRPGSACGRRPGSFLEQLA